MRSSGGVATVVEAAAHPSWALVSGLPRAWWGGAVARLGRVAGRDLVDMGGTSTDVCLIAGGSTVRSAERSVAGLPVRLPTVDLQTVGAGGGSIVRRDAAARSASGRRARAPIRVPPVTALAERDRP